MADFGGVPFTYTLDIDVPEDQRAVAPGRLVDETVADGRYRARFRVDWPARDLAVMAGPYRIDERRHGGIRLRTYFHPEIAELSRRHNDANILVLPARFLEENQGVEILRRWLEVPFDGGRHQRRVAKIEADK